jgi:perosamine synthetase
MSTARSAPRRAEPHSLAHEPLGPTASYRALAAVARPVVRILFRPTVRGLDRLPAQGGFVLSSNQLSNLDGFALADPLYPRQVQWMGKAELFRRPFAPVLRRLGIFPVRRGAGDLQAIETAVELAAGGHAVGIFPEGTRREKGLRKTHRPRAHRGAARVALTAGVPLVPAAVVGTERLTTLRRWHVAFGTPVATEGLGAATPAAAREATARLMAAIAALESELRRERTPPLRLHPRLRIDLALADLAHAGLSCLTARRNAAEAEVLRAWCDSEAIVCLSVRSGFELLLDALELRPGDEIAFSAITHPDMVRIAEARGLVPLPIDVDPDTLAPEPSLLERAITPRTRLLVVAHLFGGTMPLAQLSDAARRHGLLLVEDCAQSLRTGRGDSASAADVSLFSFGAIKTATALGGAIVRVADRTLADRMRSLQAEWPVQGRREYAGRVVKFAALHLLGNPVVYRLFAGALGAAGRELDGVVNGAVRGFPGPELVRRIRRRPSAPLLALLARRLRRFDTGRIAARTRAGDMLAHALPPGIARPGCAAGDATHWVFPILAANRERVVRELRRAGFDAATATSGITVVPTPADRPELDPAAARRILDEVVFLPAYPDLGDAELQRLAASVAALPR